MVNWEGEVPAESLDEVLKEFIQEGSAGASPSQFTKQIQTGSFLFDNKMV